MSKRPPIPPASHERKPLDLYKASQMNRIQYVAPLTLLAHQAGALSECLQGISAITDLLGMDDEDVRLNGYLKGGLIAAQAQLVAHAQWVLDDCEASISTA